jgi:hypothetical protein
MRMLQCCVEMQISQGNELKLLYAVGMDSQMQQEVGCVVILGR